LYCWGDRPVASSDKDSLPRRQVTDQPLTEVSLASGTFGDNACGIGTNGATYCWGYLLGGVDIGVPLGDPPTLPTLLQDTIPLTSLTTGRGHACGLTQSGSGVCWGSFDSGKRGQGAVPVTDGLWLASTTDLIPNVVAGQVTLTTITAGNLHTCGIASNGQALCWGFAERVGNPGAPFQASDSACVFPWLAPCAWAPVAVATSLQFTSLSAGTSHTCGVTISGAVWCWGDNSSGQLGDGTNVSRAHPSHVTLSVSAQSVTAGGGHTCITTTLGDAICWGSNTHGQLGNGGRPGFGPSLVEGDIHYQALSAGETHTCGLSSERRAYCWGNNASGQLGDGSTSGALVPVRGAAP
jgi:hypothetical protein